MRQTHRRIRSQSGNVMIETALGLLPYLAIVFGIMDFSLLIGIESAFHNAVRQGVRFGITYSLNYNGTPYTSQTDAIRAAVQDASLGFINNTNVTTYVQVNYYLPNNLSTPATAANLPQVVNSVNITALNQPGNVLEVKIAGFPWNWMVPMPGFMPGTGATVNASALDVLQGLPIGTTVPPAP